MLKYYVVIFYHMSLVIYIFTISMLTISVIIYSVLRQIDKVIGYKQVSVYCTCVHCNKEN